MAIDADKASSQDRRSGRKSVGWISSAIVIVLVVLVIWLLRGYVMAPDVEPADTTSTTTTLTAEPMVTPEPELEEEQDTDDQEAVERVPDVAGFSSGPAQAQTAKVPDLIGMGVDDAEAKVESLGLTPRLMFQPKKESTGRVYEQSPAPGTKVDEGTKVFMLAGEMPGR